MPVPNAAAAIISLEKLTGYLLAPSHPVGGSKARFFRAHGFDDATASMLADGLRAIAGQGPARAHESPFGTKYTVVGEMRTPRGTVIRVETVWIVEPHDDRPRLVTAYPA